jgi:catechol 2,3-dioxygenase-like lactoylglutathione lyase family enzyme
VEPAPRIVQLALCSDDLPATVRLYSEAFGFAESGGHGFWGEWLARIQGLGDDAACTLWWLVGRQDLVQIEVFAHTTPRQRPRGERRPNDHGWARFGVAVPDFEATLGRLAGLGVAPSAEPRSYRGSRRAAFLDPHLGIAVEVMEDGPGLAGGVRSRYYDLAPALVYAALSVADLDRARGFVLGDVGLVEEEHDLLHDERCEALWGLPGARRESFVARGGDVYLEVSRYAEPAGRRAPADALLSDQGFMNVAIGYRERERTDALLARLAAAGHPAPAPLPETPAGGVYVEDGEGNSFEVVAQPREFDADFGFVPRPGLLRPALWPQPGAPAATRDRP